MSVVTIRATELHSKIYQIYGSFAISNMYKWQGMTQALADVFKYLVKFGVDWIDQVALIPMKYEFL